MEKALTRPPKKVKLTNDLREYYQIQYLWIRKKRRMEFKWLDFLPGQNIPESTIYKEK